MGEQHRRRFDDVADSDFGDRAFSCAERCEFCAGAGAHGGLWFQYWGVSTLVGTPPNALLAGFMLENYGVTIGFLGWMILAFPPALVLLGISWLVLTKLAFRIKGNAF